MRSITASIAFAAFVAVANGGSASAQVAFSNGVTGSSSSTAYRGGTLIDLGTSTTAGYVTQMPLSLSYGNVNVDVSFTGNSGVFSGSVVGVSTSNWGNQNYFTANTGSVIMNFSTAQNTFSFDWATPHTTNQISFYNGSQLLASTGNFGSGMNKVFTFGELGYDRVVMSNTAAAFESANVRFSGVDPAPLPVGGVGGLIAFLGMMGARRRGLSWKEALREANPFARKPAPAQA